jgi:hypothetical protein
MNEEGFFVSAIRQALSKLESAVGKLEGRVVKYESSLTGVQRDMFGAPVAKKNGFNGSGHNSDVQGPLFAKRLDQAIEKVEDILRE